MIRLAQAKRMLLVPLIAGLTAGCSSLPNWANPDTWGEPADPAATTSDSSGSADQASEGTTVAEASDKYPVLADTPDKAPPATSGDEQKQVANALVADRTQAQYSAEQLRAGAEASAAPPAPASGEVSAALGAAASQPIDSPSTGPDAGVSATAPAPSGQGQAPTSAGTQTAASASPPPPALPPTPQGDAALGFQPSHAPALDPSVAQIMAGSSHPRLALAGSPAATMPAASYGPPAATVVFGSGNAIDTNGTAQVQAAVAAFRARGGQGYVRVVGHAAANTGSAAQALERAQAGATAVARELIRLGVPAKKILVNAAGRADGQQRRAEIFLES